jgi:DNA-directed RNA polymerase specialized sigma24 family protein
MRGREKPSAEFPETEWSQLSRALQLRAADKDPELNEFLGRYWRPAFHYVRTIRRLSIADAEDLTQGFFTMFLARFDLEQLTPERGSFRGLLKVALRRFVATVERKQYNRAELERDPQFIEEAWAASSSEPGLTPDEAFEKKRAEIVLEAALQAVEKELLESGRQLYFAVFRDYCFSEREHISYESVAALHQLKADDVRNYLRVVRQRLRVAVRRLLRDYLFPGEDIESELARVFARHG